MKRLLYIWPLFILLGCSESKCWKSVGDATIRTENLEPFNELHIHDHFNVFLGYDSVYRAEIHGGENLVNHLKLNKKGGKLVLKDENMCDFVRSYDDMLDVYIYAPTYRSIECHNTGDVIVLDTIRGGYFSFQHWNASGVNQVLVVADTVILKQHTGTGDITCAGRSRDLFLYNASYGYSDCRNLDSKYGSVSILGTGDAEVQISTSLIAVLESEGNLHVYGNPTRISENVSGKGKIILE